MFKNFIISYIRSLFRNKTSSFINIFGLSIGLASCFIIMFFVINELSIDQFQKNRKNIYRVITQDKNHTTTSAYASYLFGPAAKLEFPEIKEYARMIHLGAIKIKKNNQFIEENGVHFADQSIFKMLTFHFLEGNPDEGITGANSIAISESMAEKFFGKSAVVGKSLLLSIKGEEQLVTITLVYKDLPQTSSLQLDFIGNLEFGKKNLMKLLIFYGNDTPPKEWTDSWDHNFYTNLVQLSSENTNTIDLENKINKTFKKYNPDIDNSRFSLQRFDKIYLHSSDIINDSQWKQGKLKNIYIFSALAILILIIACFNYLILSLAQSEKRAREIGIRKASGADFKNLLKQVLLESAVISCISLPIAIGLTELLLPILNSLLDKNLVIHYGENLAFILGVLVITMVISIISGLYIALYLNKFNPIEILRGNKIHSSVRSLFLKSLVVLQIAIFIALIISSLVIIKQLRFAVNYNPGIEPNNVSIIKTNDISAQIHYQVFKQELEKLPEIRSVTASLFIPPSTFKFSMQIPRVDDPSKMAQLEALLVDYNFIETLGLKIIEGRSFSKDHPSDANGVIINESAIQELGLKETIGKKLPIGTIIGIVKDFHIHDLHSKITPAYMVITSQNFFEMAVKTKTDAASVKTKIEEIWKKVNHDTRFESTTLTSKIENQYQSEKRLSRIIITFTIIAILIAAMGLFGLSNFITLLRTKEIGIRKVNGGTQFQMILLFWRELLMWTGIAFVLSCPVAWYLMHQWLGNFAYQTELSLWIFVMAGILALFISLFTVSWQAYRVGNRNPVEALRYE